MAQSDNPGVPTGGAGGSGDDDFGTHEVRYYRGDFDAHTERTEAHTFEQARPAYQLGHAAGSNPAYLGRPYVEVEVELERSYQPQGETRWEHVRQYARRGFEWRSIVGGLALAAGGWWAGKALQSALSDVGEEDENAYRTHFESFPARPDKVTYDRARTGYLLGHTAAYNPDYRGRAYEEVEPELRQGFTGDNAGQYDALRDFTRYGYERGSTRAPGDV
jgi:hypothetical protein